MRRFSIASFVVAILVACSSPPASAPRAAPAAPSPAATPTGPGADEPLATMPYTPVLDVGSMDKSVDPCVDLYAYSCGGWQKQNPIPPDQAAWSAGNKLGDQVRRHVWGLLLEASRPKTTSSPVEKQLGTYFAACMDEAGIEAKGKTPLEPTLASLAAVRSISHLPKWLAAQELAGNRSLAWDINIEQDASDATRYIFAIGTGGLSLPNRDDYLEKDAKSTELRDKLGAHIEKMLALLGDDPATAKETAAIVLRIETSLAKGTLTEAEARDPHKTFHRMTPAQLAAIAPAIDWKTYFEPLGVVTMQSLDVSQPAFVKAMDATFKHESLDAMKRWLRWRYVHQQAHLLSKAFVDEHFYLFSRYLRGVETQLPRWKRCTGWASGDLGEAVGELFVRKNFGPEVKASAEALVAAIETAMEAELGELTWMSAATKKEALNKLHAMRNKIGHPKTFRDYSSVRVAPDDLVGNVAHASTFDLRYSLAHLGKPVDRTEWAEPPQLVDQYYNPQMNEMNFPAAGLLPPFFDAKLDEAPNYGDMGATVGHELIHGFDDNGRQYDAAGNLKNWWADADAKAFEKRASCISNQYSSYVAIDDVHVNGALTLGEDMADLGGLVLAYRAWAPKHASDAPRDDLTPPQRFFVGYAQWACANVRPEAERVHARTDPHSPYRFRINGTAVNMPEYARAFSCKPGQPMVKPASEICSVW